MKFTEEKLERAFIELLGLEQTRRYQIGPESRINFAFG
jgi:hypothetical protein